MSFLWLSPAFADDSEDGFLSQTLNMVSSYFSNDDDEDDSDNTDGDEGNIGVMPPVVVAPPAMSDLMPPAISIQQPAITIEALAAQSTVNLGIVNATDLVDGMILATNNAPATFQMGVTTVTYTATDAAGNTATAQQQVTVQDTIPPIITALAAITVDSITGQAVTVSIGAATASDAFTPVNITNNAPATFPMGNTTVIWTATDANGNTSTAIQTVTVNDALILANLPPDPGAAGKTTLEGIDSDNDGVRDDVQRWIAINYPNSEKTRAALTQITKTMQQFLLNAADPVQSYNTSVQMGKDTRCTAFILSVSFSKHTSAHKAVFLDTYLRSKTWLQADQHLSGKMFKSLPFDQWKQACNFNPDVMPN